METNNLPTTPIQVVNNNPSSTIPNSSQVNKTPWSYRSMLLVALLTNEIAAYLIVWQSLKRIGENKEAKKFLLVNIITILIVQLLTIFIVKKPYIVSIIASYCFVYWFNTKYFKKWQIENPNKAKFSWSLLGWGFIGFLISFTISSVAIYIFQL